jgi:hypothetical protein
MTDNEMIALLQSKSKFVSRTLTIKGVGSVQLKGHCDPTDLGSIANLLCEQEPTCKVVAAMAALVASQSPSSNLLRDLCRILGQLIPTKPLLESLAELVAEEHSNIYFDLVHNHRPTKSTLNILASLVAQQTPTKRLVQALTDLFAEQPPTMQLLTALRTVVYPKMD